MEDTNDQIVIADEDVTEEDFSEDELKNDSIDWKAKAAELKGIAKRRATQLRKVKDAAAKAAVAAKAVDASKEADTAPNQKNAAPKTSELDETQLTLLEVKGITEQEDIDVIQKIMVKTGQTLTQTLKDEYVQAKLKAQKDEREVKNAMPTSTKRGGSQSDGFDAALAKAEQSGGTVLPTDFALRVRVVNAMAARERGNQPSWHS